MSRAKEIAAEIINEVLPNACADCFVDELIRPAIEAIVEKRLLRPHQVKDRFGRIWEQVSNGLYIQMPAGITLEKIESWYEPLTEVQGEKMPDAGEVAKLKARIAEKEKQSIKMEIEHDEIMNAAIAESDRQRERIAKLEKRSMEIVLSSAEVRGVCDNQKNRIAELEKQLAEAKAEPAKTITAKEHVIAAIDRLWDDYEAEVSARHSGMANYTRIIELLTDALEEME